METPPYPTPHPSAHPPRLDTAAANHKLPEVTPGNGEKPGESPGAFCRRAKASFMVPSTASDVPRRGWMHRGGRTTREDAMTGAPV